MSCFCRIQESRPGDGVWNSSIGWLGADFGHVADEAQRLAVVFRRRLLEPVDSGSFGPAFWSRLRWRPASGSGGVVGSTIVVVSVHLPWMGTAPERAQGVSPRRGMFAQVLLELVHNIQRPHEPLVVAGDMNDPFHATEVAFRLGLRDCFFDLNRIAPATYPAFFDPARFGHAFGERGAVAYDWIFLSRELAAVEAEAVDAAWQGVPVSDHRAVRATVLPAMAD